jgi:hypothetical protein
MTWQSVGQHTFLPTDRAVQVGSFDLAPGQDTLWVRITQITTPEYWPWSYGILSWRSASGLELGSAKAYSTQLGEVFRLGVGLPPSDRNGSIWFEPRGYNLGWIKAGFPWTLSFEAQSGPPQVVAPVINSVTLSEDDPTGNRFTSQTFTTTVTMTEDGIPASSKGLKAYVEGSLRLIPQSDVITAVDAQPSPTVYDQKVHSQSGAKTLTGPSVLYAAASLKNSNIAVGTAPPNAGDGLQYEWLMFDMKVKCSVTIGRSTSTTNSSAILFGTNDPNAAWVQAAIGTYNDKREVSGGGFRYYAYGWTLDSNITASSVNNASSPHAYYPTSASAEVILTFASDKELANFDTGDAVNQDDSAASGTVESVDATAKTMTLGNATGTWGPPNAGRYVIGPEKILSNVKLYTVHDAAGAVSDLRSADPGFVTMTGSSPYNLTFPATFPTGNAPDVDLPPGTTLTTEVEAKNTAATATATSNTITPA